MGQFVPVEDSLHASGALHNYHVMYINPAMTPFALHLTASCPKGHDGPLSRQNGVSSSESDRREYRRARSAGHLLARIKLSLRRARRYDSFIRLRTLSLGDKRGPIGTETQGVA